MSVYEQKEIAIFKKFMNSYDTDEFIKRYKWEIAKYGINLESLFQEVTIAADYDQANSIEPILSWWPKNQFPEMQDSIHFNKYFITGVHPEGLQSGEHTTLKVLWSAQNDTNKLAALLLSASLHRRVSNGIDKEFWPHPIAIERLYNQLLTKWQTGTSIRWHPRTTSAIPVMVQDFHMKIGTPVALCMFLASEHAQLLSQCTPVRISFITHK